MSKSCWEQGEIKLPSAEAVAFRHGVVKFYNELQTRLFTEAVRVHKQIVAEGKGKRNFDYEKALTDALTKPGTNYSWTTPVHEDGFSEIFDVILPYVQVEGKGWQRSRKPKAPKKKDFKLAPLSVKGLQVGHEAGIEFKKGNVIRWAVSENNHAVERAHDHPLAKEIFKRLERINWTSRSGGEIVGNDEYNEDNREAGGGANYVTFSYGKETKKDRLHNRALIMGALRRGW
jgi:hypothetical protein